MKIIKALSCAPRESPVHRLRQALIAKATSRWSAAAFTESDTVRLVREWHPDVLLLDATSFNANDVGTLIRVHASSPSTKVLFRRGVYRAVRAARVAARGQRVPSPRHFSAGRPVRRPSRSGGRIVGGTETRFAGIPGSACRTGARD